MSGAIDVRADDTAGEASAGKVDMKLEVVTIPVYDVDRATAFHRSLGWRQDVTPPGSACSVQFGTKRTSSVPGSAQNQFLIVPDIQAARDELVGALRRGERGLPPRPGRPGRRSRSGASQLRFVRLVQPSEWQPLAASGDHDAAARSHRCGVDDVRLSERSGKHDAACLGCPRRAREAPRRRIGRELARLVRRLHGGGAVRRGAARVSDYDVIVIGGLRVAAAIVTWLFVSDERAEAPPLAAPDRGWALPVREAEATS